MNTGCVFLFVPAAFDGKFGTSVLVLIATARIPTGKPRNAVAGSIGACDEFLWCPRNCPSKQLAKGGPQQCALHIYIYIDIDIDVFFFKGTLVWWF